MIYSVICWNNSPISILILFSWKYIYFICEEVKSNLNLKNVCIELFTPMSLIQNSGRLVSQSVIWMVFNDAL
jgi:hypothetical protein